jgi:hypothetical protein
MNGTRAAVMLRDGSWRALVSARRGSRVALAGAEMPPGGRWATGPAMGAGPGCRSVTADVTAAELRSCQAARPGGLLPGMALAGVADGSRFPRRNCPLASRAPARVWAVLPDCPDACGR